MECSRCTATLAPNANFCSRCGCRVVRDDHHLESVRWQESDVPQWHAGRYKGVYTFSDGRTCSIVLDEAAHCHFFQQDRTTLLMWLDMIWGCRPHIERALRSEMLARRYSDTYIDALLASVDRIDVHEDGDWCADIHYRKPSERGRSWDNASVRVDLLCEPEFCVFGGHQIDLTQ